MLVPQIYYQLSRIRQARRIRDVVLVRLEQLAPFPHDLISRVRAYPVQTLASVMISMSANLM